MVYRVSFDEGYSMRYILLCISFLLAIPISGFAQSGLVWKKQLHPSEVLSVTGTDWVYGVSTAKDTIKIWNMKNGDIVKTIYCKDVFVATVDSTLNYVVSGNFKEGYQNFGHVKVLKLDSSKVIAYKELKEHESDSWYVKDFKYSSVIDRRGLPLLISTQIYITKGQSNWHYGRISSSDYTSQKNKPIDINDQETYTPEKLRITNDGKNIYGCFHFYERISHYPSGYDYISSSVFEVYTLPTLQRQQSRNISKQLDKFSFPLLQSKDGQLLFSKNSIYNSNNLQEIRSGCVPENIREVETIIDENHLLCLPKGTEAALAIWNIVEKRWEYEFEGSEQIKLAVTSDEKYAFTTDNAGYVSMWRLPDSLKNDSIDIRFDISKRKLYVGDTVEFVNRTLPFASTNSYNWDFGDGITTSEIHTKKVYREQGEFTVRLEVMLKNGVKKCLSRKVNIINKPSLLYFSNKFIASQSVSHIDLSKDNDNILFVPKDDSVVKYNLKKQITEKMYCGENPICSFFTHNGDSVITFSKRYISDSLINSEYTVKFKRHIVDIFGKSDADRSSNRAYAVPVYLEHYKQPLYWWADNYRKATREDFRVRKSSDRNLFVVGCDIRYKPTFIEESDENNIRGDVIHCTTKENIATDVRLEQGTPCIPELKVPIRSIDIKGDMIALSTDSFKDTQSPICKLSVPQILITKKGTKEIHKTLKDNSFCVRYSPDNYHLVSTSGIWDIDSNKIIHRITTPFNTEFEILPDGDNIVLPYKNEQGAIAGIYSIRENKWRTYFYGSPSRGLIDVTALAISDDGKYVATGSSTGAVALWQIPDSLKPKPHAEFRIMKYKGTVGEPIRFYNTSIPVHNNFTYTWYFGDGTTSTEKNPTHVYENKGIYSTRLVMKDSVGNEYSYRHNTYVEIEIPTGFREENNKTILSVYPNPCDEKVMVEVVEYPCELSISDMNGAIVYKSFVESETLSIESKTFPTGIYTVRTKVGDSIKSAHCLIIH